MAVIIDIPAGESRDRLEAELNREDRPAMAEAIAAARERVKERVCRWVCGHLGNYKVTERGSDLIITESEL